jgi:hypothetical protein
MAQVFNRIFLWMVFRYVQDVSDLRPGTPARVGVSWSRYSHFGIEPSTNEFGGRSPSSGCGDRMIKSVVVPRLVAREHDLDRLHAVLSELGFQTGDTWDDDRSRGLPLLAPLGALEFYHGQPPAPAEVIVEVDDVQQALQTLRRHDMKILAEVSRTHWGADMLVTQIGGCCIAFFSWAEQAEAPHPKAA